jgi:hypothetical protein
LPHFAKGKKRGTTFQCGDCMQRWKLANKGLIRLSSSGLSERTLRLLRGPSKI